MPNESDNIFMSPVYVKIISLNIQCYVARCIQSSADVILQSFAFIIAVKKPGFLSYKGKLFPSSF